MRLYNIYNTYNIYNIFNNERQTAWSAFFLSFVP